VQLFAINFWQQTEKAIAAFAALAERLDALAAERARRSWFGWRKAG
jgi:hypothetical protein